MEKSFRKSGAEAEQAWLVGQMWRAFPEAESEHHLADLMAEFLTTAARPITARTVRLWLRGETTPHWRYVPPILALAGAEAVFDLIEGRAA